MQDFHLLENLILLCELLIYLPLIDQLNRNFHFGIFVLCEDDYTEGALAKFT